MKERYNIYLVEGAWEHIRDKGEVIARDLSEVLEVINQEIYLYEMDDEKYNELTQDLENGNTIYLYDYKITKVG